MPHKLCNQDTESRHCNSLNPTQEFYYSIGQRIGEYMIEHCLRLNGDGTIEHYVEF